MTDEIPHIWFLKTRYDLIDLGQTVALIKARAAADLPFVYVATPNAQAVVRKNQGTEPDADAAWDGAWISTNDSGPVNAAARKLFKLDLGRVTGADLTVEMLNHHIPASTPLTLIGGDEALEDALQARYGFGRIARYNPPMGLRHDQGEIDRCARFIIDNPAPYTFLIVGTPQAEIVAHRAVEMGGGKGVGFCVGSAMHFAVGLTARAPLIFRTLGLEWLHRLALNPRRHFRRVFVQSLPVLGIALKARLAGRP
jgi:N-acetylglucosaminyldiphosphoundecaprenol N-acetyl-beta-D-mannosaminyltransferase